MEGEESERIGKMSVGKVQGTRVGARLSALRQQRLAYPAGSGGRVCAGTPRVAAAAGAGVGACGVAGWLVARGVVAGVLAVVRAHVRQIVCKTRSLSAPGCIRRALCVPCSGSGRGGGNRGSAIGSSVVRQQQQEQSAREPPFRNEAIVALKRTVGRCQRFP